MGAEFFSQSDNAMWEALVTPLLARLANSGSLQNLLLCADFDEHVSKTPLRRRQRFKKHRKSNKNVNNAYGQ